MEYEPAIFCNKICRRVQFYMNILRVLVSNFTALGHTQSYLLLPAVYVLLPAIQVLSPALQVLLPAVYVLLLVVQVLPAASMWLPAAYMLLPVVQMLSPAKHVLLLVVYVLISALQVCYLIVCVTCGIGVITCEILVVYVLLHAV